MMLLNEIKIFQNIKIKSGKYFYVDPLDIIKLVVLVKKLRIY